MVSWPPDIHVASSLFPLASAARPRLRKAGPLAPVFLSSTKGQLPVSMSSSFADLLDSGDRSLYAVRSTAPGPSGTLPITPEMLLKRPAGDLFGWAQAAGMGWDPSALGGKEFLVLEAT